MFSVAFSPSLGEEVKKVHVPHPGSSRIHRKLLLRASEWQQRWILQGKPMPWPSSRLAEFGHVMELIQIHRHCMDSFLETWSLLISNGLERVEDAFFLYRLIQHSTAAKPNQARVIGNPPIRNSVGGLWKSHHHHYSSIKR